jgi:uncharacterized heparinase superfamily protein
MSTASGGLSHDDAAKAAAEHLNAAVAALRAAYDHPHHRGRVENVEQQIRNLVSVIEHMPETEASRAEYAERMLAVHRTMDPARLASLNHHDRELLAQELERSGR